MFQVELSSKSCDVQLHSAFGRERREFSTGGAGCQPGLAATKGNGSA